MFSNCLDGKASTIKAVIGLLAFEADCYSLRISGMLSTQHFYLSCSKQGGSLSSQVLDGGEGTCLRPKIQAGEAQNKSYAFTYKNINILQ